jgi:hypothetical protein
MAFQFQWFDHEKHAKWKQSSVQEIIQRQECQKQGTTAGGKRLPT